MLSTTGQPACCSPIYVNIVDQSTSKHSDGAQTLNHWCLTKNFNEISDDMQLRKPPTTERYQNNMMTVALLNHKGESSFNRFGSTAVFQNQATGSSDYKSTTASTSLIPQVRPIFLYFSSRSENSKNPWLQYTAGRQASWFRLFTGTTDIQAM